MTSTCPAGCTAVGFFADTIFVSMSGENWACVA
jgi:hypothetical protein